MLANPILYGMEKITMWAKLKSTAVQSLLAAASLALNGQWQSMTADISSGLSRGCSRTAAVQLKYTLSSEHAMQNGI